MSGPNYGAQTLDLTPPNGALQVATDGTGGMQAVLEQAMRDVPQDGTIVLHEGDWPVSVAPPRGKRFTIQPAPGTRPRLVGYLTSRAEAWRSDRDWWYLPEWAPFPSTPNDPEIIDRSHPLASVPEQVWVDGVPATLVHPGELQPGHFAVGPDRLWIADDPASHEIWVAVRQWAFVGSPDARVDLHGLDVVGYATTSMRRAAVTVFADDTLVSHVRIVECSAAGISARGRDITLHRLDLLGNGQLGFHAWRAHGLDVGGSIISGNNRKQFARIGEAGGAKWFETTDVVAHDNLLVNNNGHGLWADGRSDRGQFLRNDIIGGASSGIHFEGSADAEAYGNRVTACPAGILGSNCGGFDVAHNTVVGNDRDIFFQRSNPSDQFPSGGNIRRGNRTTVPEPPAVPTAAEIAALHLTAAQATDPHTGWYGATPTPEEPPVAEPYDADPLHRAIAGITGEAEAAVTELRRLEAIIANDVDLRTIADLRAELLGREIEVWTLAVEKNGLNAAITNLNGLVTNQNDTINTLTDQRDAARAHAQELELRHVDDRLTIADLTQRLADCQAAHEPPPEIERIIIGGSHKQGWPALKQMTAPVAPDAYRMFVPSARLSSGSIDKIRQVVQDGASPWLSLTKPDNVAETDLNIGLLLQANLGLDGVVMLIHEMTQKIAGPAFKALIAEHYPIYRDRLPLWKRIITFQRFDFNDPTLDRYPANYLPDDLTLIDGIGVDVYDKHRTTGHTFAELMAPVEEFAEAHGDLTIYVPEMSCPDTGQYGRPPGWKPTWILDAYVQMRDTLKADGTRRYAGGCTYNSNFGDDSPPAVPADPPDQPEVKEGWYCDSTPEALEAYVDVIEESRA